MYCTHASSVKLERCFHHTPSIPPFWIVSLFCSSITLSSGSFPDVFVDFSFQIFSFRCDLTHNDTISTNFPSGPPDETIGLIAKSLISVIIQAAIWITETQHLPEHRGSPMNRIWVCDDQLVQITRAKNSIILECLCLFEPQEHRSQIVFEWSYQCRSAYQSHGDDREVRPFDSWSCLTGHLS